MAKGKKTGGRKAGTPNKMTAKAKEAFAMAFNEVGGIEALIAWAQKNPTEFYKLYAKLIPTDMNVRQETLAELVIGAQPK